MAYKFSTLVGFTSIVYFMAGIKAASIWFLVTLVFEVIRALLNETGSEEDERQHSD